MIYLLQQTFIGLLEMAILWLVYVVFIKNIIQK